MLSLKPCAHAILDWRKLSLEGSQAPSVKSSPPYQEQGATPSGNVGWTNKALDFVNHSEDFNIDEASATVHSVGTREYPILQLLARSHCVQTMTIRRDARTGEKSLTMDCRAAEISQKRMA